MRISCQFSSQFEIWFLKAIFILHSCVTCNTRCCYLFSLHWETFPHIYFYLWSWGIDLDICVWILICDTDFHFGLFCLLLILIDPSSYEIYTFLYSTYQMCNTLTTITTKNLTVCEHALNSTFYLHSKSRDTQNANNKFSINSFFVLFSYWFYHFFTYNLTLNYLLLHKLFEYT